MSKIICWIVWQVVNAFSPPASHTKLFTPLRSGSFVLQILGEEFDKVHDQDIARTEIEEYKKWMMPKRNINALSCLCSKQ